MTMQKKIPQHLWYWYHLQRFTDKIKQKGEKKSILKRLVSILDKPNNVSLFKA